MSPDWSYAELIIGLNKLFLLCMKLMKTWINNIAFELYWEYITNKNTNISSSVYIADTKKAVNILITKQKI